MTFDQLTDETGPLCLSQARGSRSTFFSYEGFWDPVYAGVDGRFNGVALMASSRGENLGGGRELSLTKGRKGAGRPKDDVAIR